MKFNNCLLAPLFASSALAFPAHESNDGYAVEARQSKPEVHMHMVNNDKHQKIGFEVGSTIPETFKAASADDKGAEWAAKTFMHFKSYLQTKGHDETNQKWHAHIKGFGADNKGVLMIGVSSKEGNHLNPQDFNKLTDDFKSYFTDCCTVTVKEKKNQKTNKQQHQDQSEKDQSSSNNNNSNNNNNNNNQQQGDQGKSQEHPWKHKSQQQKPQKVDGGQGCSAPEDLRKNFITLSMKEEQTQVKAVTCNNA